MNNFGYYSAPFGRGYRWQRPAPDSGEGLGYYAGPEVVPARIIYNGLGEPIGALALPGLISLIPKAMSMVAPVLKTAGSLIPQATSALNVAKDIGTQALPLLQQSLPGPGAAPAQPLPASPEPSPAPAPVAPLPMATPMLSPVPSGPGMSVPGPRFVMMRRRRRRRYAAPRRRSRGMPVEDAAPPAPSRMPLPPPPPPSPMPPPSLPVAPQTASDASGGMGGYGWPTGYYGQYGYYGRPF